MRLCAALLCAAMAGCADEEAASPGSIEPSVHELPLPPVKPERPKSAALHAAFTESISLRRSL